MSLHVAIRPLFRLIALLPVLLAGIAWPAAGQTDLDALMERVLKNRDESWRQLQEFLLSEREALSLVGPDFTRLYGMEREFVWVAREGIAVRTPTKVNGVTVSTDQASTPEGRRAHEEATLGKFMRFPFEQGNYYLAGRETIDDVEVLRVEYYPTRMFRPDENRERRRAKDRPEDSAKGRDERSDSNRDTPREQGRDKELEERIDVAFNKVSLVTLWVDPAQHQIVRATFDNVDFSFLPGRSLVRVEAAQATMEMGRPIAGIWLPVRTTVEGAATIATGTYRATYSREYFDYRRTDVRVTFRVREP